MAEAGDGSASPTAREDVRVRWYDGRDNLLNIGGVEAVEDATERHPVSDVDLVVIFALESAYGDAACLLVSKAITEVVPFLTLG